MINVSNAWHLAISNDKRQYLEYADITLENGVVLKLENKDFWQGGFTYEDAVSSDNDLQVGSAIVNKCNLVINNIYGDYDTYDFTNAKVILRIGLALDGDPEIVRRGTYKVNNATFNGDLITLECLDNMIAFDKPYDSKLTFPATLNSIVRDVCTECGVQLNTYTFPNDSYIVSTRPEDESTTYREVLAWATQIAGCFARCNVNGQLEIKWYPTLSLQEDAETILDGGIFDQNIPYSSGNSADGGTFNPWTTGYDYDAGTFADIVTVHHITSLYNRNVSVDDVIITGVKVLVKDESEGGSGNVIQEFLSGTSGYVIEIENNPFITLDTANEVVGFLGLQLIGTKFRKASITHGSDPCIEAGDVALVLDRKNNIYPILISKTTFSSSGAQQTVSSAQTPVRNSSARFSAETKNYVELRKRLTNERTVREQVEKNLTDRVNSASGLYETQETDSSGATITYLHDKKLLSESNVQIKISDVGVTVTPDGGSHWYGLTVDGDLVARILTATGVNADWIDTGQLVIRDNQGNVTFSADTATGYVRIVASEFSLSTGDTINSIATDRASHALSDSKNYTDQIVAGYREEVDAIIGNIQDQLDDKIESWYYDYEPTMQNEPASEWTTEEDKKAHEGDVFYWKSTGHAYRFMDNNGTWGWQLIEDTGITTAIAKAEAAQSTANVKKRIFVAQPTPPYDIGDLWVQGKTGDILKCATPRESGNYLASDWDKASKYTDDTALNNFIEGSYATTLQNIQGQIDGKAETWSQENDPATGWDTPSKRSEHIGDLWYNSAEGVQSYYRWNGSSWDELTANPPRAVFDEIDGKAQIFIDQPTPPYAIGDLWFNDETSDIMTCVNTRAEGDFVESDWQKRNKYTDDTAVENLQIGGRNLIKNTLNPDVSTVDDYPMLIDQSAVTAFNTGTKTVATHGIRQTNTSASRTFIRFGSATISSATLNGLEQGETYTLSFDASWRVLSSDTGKSDTKTYAMKAMLYTNKESASTFAIDQQEVFAEVTQADKGTEMSGRCEFTFTVDMAVTKLYLLIANERTTSSNYAIGDFIELRNIKLEKGSKATDWTPAFEDQTAETNNLINFFVNGEYAETLQEIKDQIDEKVETWSQSTDPSTAWKTTEEKNEHKGDIWYNSSDDVKQFYTYDGTKWVEMASNPPKEVLDTLDGKAQIFINQPKPPYSVGDLWFSSSTSDILTCTTARESGSYVSTDWEKRNKYTDDSSLTTWINGDFQNTVSDIRGQIDQKAETWYQSTDPSTAWNTSDLKKEHEGDLWYCTAINNPTYLQNQTYRWNGSTWVKQDAPKEVFDLIDGKAQIFTGNNLPKPPYYLGDLWFNATQDNTGDIKTCVNTRLTGNGSDSDWKVRNKYTDDAKIDNWLDGSTTTYPKFSSFLNVLPNTINATVKASGVYAEKASIIATINNSGESSVKIDANKVNLSAYSTISDTQSMISASTKEIEISVQKKANEKNGSYRGEGVPTSSNYPASSWLTNEEKMQHDGDLYVDSKTGITYQYSAMASSGLLLTFDSNSRTEAESRDYVVIYYQFGNNYYASQRFGGTSIAGKTFFVPSRTCYVLFHTDGSSSNYYGFKFSSITRTTTAHKIEGTIDFLPEYEQISVSGSTYPESAHNSYGDNRNQFWKYTYSTSFTPSVSGTWTAVKDEDIAKAQAAADSASASIQVLSNQISSKVSKGSIISEINQSAEDIKISASKVNISGFVTFTDLYSNSSTYINGDYIQTGHINFKYLQGGILKLGGSSNGNGQLYVYDSYNNQKIYINSSGANFGNGYTTIDTSGNLSSKSLTANDYFYLSGGTKSYLYMNLSGSYGNTTVNGYFRIKNNPGVTDHGFTMRQVKTYSGRNDIFQIDIDDGVIIDSGSYHVSLDEALIVGLGRQSSRINDNGFTTNNYGTEYYFRQTGARFASLVVTGSKQRIVDTKDYATRSLYCYETTSPYFGDIGEGIIAEDGMCYVSIESIFSETIATDNYHVFLQKCGNGDCYISEKKSSYFVVSGTPGLRFSWEIKAKQVDLSQRCLEMYDWNEPNINNNEDYYVLGTQHIEQIQREREVIS